MFTFQHTVKKSNTKISTYEIISLYLKIFTVIFVLPIKFLICFGICSHYTKNHISQVLEYHEKFKNTKKISTFHQLFRSKKDRISYLWKVQNKNFSVLKKHDVPCWRKYHLTSTFWTKRRPYFPPLKSSKQELFCNQKTWYSILKKISSYINFWIKRRPYFPSPKSSKQELSHKMNFSFRAKFMFL